jgi:hypothetical protein
VRAFARHASNGGFAVAPRFALAVARDFAVMCTICHQWLRKIGAHSLGLARPRALVEHLQRFNSRSRRARDAANDRLPRTCD